MSELKQNYYGSLCTEMYEILHEQAPQDELNFYLSHAEKGKKILEPLCGSGRFLVPFLKRGFDISGMDLSGEMLAKLKQKAPDAKAIQADIIDYAVQEQFDYIFIPSGSVSLFTDMGMCQRILQKMKELLAPGGKFVFAVDTVFDRCEEDGDYKVNVSVKTKEGYDLLLKGKNHAFLIAEGYFRTRNVKKYMGRLFVFALISEIPFNLMTGGGWLYPYHQNVLWTFLIAIVCMIGIDKAKASGRNIAVKIIWILLIVFGGWLTGTITFVDYYGFGVLTVLTFYAFHGKRWWDYFAQIIILYYINVELLGGLYFEVNIFGVMLEIVQQGLALLALPIIWLYNGERGYHKKWWQYFCYAFYPLHMLVLYLVFLLYVTLH